MANCRNNHSGRIRLCPLRPSDPLSACRYRCFCAGTGSSDRRIPGDRFLSRDVTGFPGASDLAGVCLPFRVVSAVLNPFCLVSVHALLLRRLLAVFFGFVVRLLSVWLSFSLFGASFPFLSCRRGYVPELCVWGIRRVFRSAKVPQRLRDRVENGGGAAVFSVAMIFGIPTSGVPCFSG